jgi:hypothetical protein
VKHPFIITVFLFANATFSHQPIDAESEHGIIFYNKSNFAGWPANEGIWRWDNGKEMLVGFEVSEFLERDDTHNVDRHSPKRVVFARTLDGGQTWKLEEHPEIRPPKYIGDPALFDIEQPKATEEDARASGGINFSHPDFAMKLRNDAFYFSYNRGNQWHGAYKLPDFGFRRLLARSCYIVNDADTAKFFFSVSPESNGNHNRTMMIETRDGGLTFDFVSWVAPGMRDKAPEAKNTFSTMPAVVRLPNGRIIAALRQRIDRRKWTDIFASDDNGRAWQFVSTAEEGSSNPPALVHLGGERVALVYGYRGKPFGLRGQISEDGGGTWSAPYVLRDDAFEWDLGYVRAALADDGRVVAVYYYTTQERREQHIAYTLWTIPESKSGNSPEAIRINRSKDNRR